MNEPTRERLPLWFLFANWLLVLGAFALGVWLGGSRGAVLPEPEATALRLVMHQILESHVDPQDPHDLATRALHGMVDELDEYSHYYEPERAARFDEEISGVYEGIGVVPLEHQGEELVYYPLAGGPAAAAGLQPGDRFVAVDGVRIADLPAERRAEELRSRLRGKAGDKVRLLLQRGDAAPFEVVLQRGPVQSPSVRWVERIDEAHGLGYVRISDFQRKTAAELQDAIEQLQRDSGGGLRGLCIDLRRNGGGLLDQCVAVARLFLQSGNIVTAKHRDSVVADQSFDAIPAQCRYPDLPLVLLVSGDTASACEVLCGALQDHHRAVVVGMRTYGKGVINTIYSWQDQGFRLKLTTARYFTPNGRCLDRHYRDRGDEPPGITPDREVELQPALLNTIEQQLERAYEVPQDCRQAVAALEAKLHVVRPRPFGADRDPQLAAALEALRAAADAGKEAGK